MRDSNDKMFMLNYENVPLLVLSNELQPIAEDILASQKHACSPDNFHTLG